MTNVDYSCQEAVKNYAPDFAVPDVATVVGTGGFGAWAAIYLAIAGVKQLILINPTGRTGDTEDIAGREIALGPFYDRHFGMAKVDALEEIALAMRPDIAIEKHKILFDPAVHGDLLKGNVFAGVSNMKIINGIFMEAKARGLKCFTGSYYAHRVGTYDSYPQGMIMDAKAPVWVGSAALSALLTVNSAIVSSTNYHGDLSELNLHKQALEVRLLAAREASC
jgi:hypothetical protein